MIPIESPPARRVFGRGALILALVLASACRRDGDEVVIPIGRSDQELVVVTRPLESAFARSALTGGRRPKKDDGATGWDHRFEEKADPPDDGVVNRRFRATVANRSDKVRTVRLDIDYLTPGTRELLRHRTLRLVVVPPFSEKSISGFTRFRADRQVTAELRAVEVEPE